MNSTSPQQEPALSIILSRLRNAVANSSDNSKWLHEIGNKLKRIPVNPSPQNAMPSGTQQEPDIIAQLDMIVEELLRINGENTETLTHISQIV